MKHHLRWCPTPFRYMLVCVAAALVLLPVLSACSRQDSAVPTALAPQASTASNTTVSAMPTQRVELDRTGHLAYLFDVFEYGRRDRIRVIDLSTGSESALAIDCYLCDSMSWSRDGEFIAYSGTVDPPTGHSEVFTLQLATGAIKQVTNSPELKYGVALSRDGKSSVIDIADPKDGQPDLAMLDMRTGQAQILALTPGQDYDPAWSPDGRRIAYVYSEDYRKGWNVWLMDTDGRNAAQLSKLPVGDQISWSPNSMMLAVSSPLECGSIYLLDVKGHDPVKLTDLNGCASSPVWSPSGHTIAFVNRVYVDPSTRTEVKEWTIYLVSVDGKEIAALKSGSGNRNPTPTYLTWTGN